MRRVQYADPEFGIMHLLRARALSDLGMLEIKMDLLWGSDASPELVRVRGRHGVRARISKQVRPEVARMLVAEIEDGAPPGEDVGTPPPQLERCRVVLEDALGAAVRLAPGSGPRYLVWPGGCFLTTAELLGIGD